VPIASRILTANGEPFGRTGWRQRPLATRRDRIPKKRQNHGAPIADSLPWVSR